MEGKLCQEGLQEGRVVVRMGMMVGTVMGSALMVLLLGGWDKRDTSAWIEAWGPMNL